MAASSYVVLEITSAVVTLVSGHALIIASIRRDCVYNLYMIACNHGTVVLKPSHKTNTGAGHSLSSKSCSDCLVTAVTTW